MRLFGAPHGPMALGLVIAHGHRMDPKRACHVIRQSYKHAIVVVVAPGGNGDCWGRIAMGWGGGVGGGFGPRGLGPPQTGSTPKCTMSKITLFPHSVCTQRRARARTGARSWPPPSPRCPVGFRVEGNHLVAAWQPRKIEGDRVASDRKP